MSAFKRRPLLLLGLLLLAGALMSACGTTKAKDQVHILTWKGEVNPVMAFFLEQGPLIFTSVKYLLTSLAVVIFLLVNHNLLPRARFRMNNLFTFAIASFAIVVVWEIVLIYVIATRT